MDKVKVMGNNISHREIGTESNKSQRIANAWLPRHKKELRSFLMFRSFYHRFLNGFAQMFAPMHGLTAVKTNHIWGDEADKILEHMKKCFAHPPILAVLTIKKRFAVFVDAIRVAVGASLMQKQENGKSYPIQ